MSSEDIDRAPVRFASVAFGEIFFRDLVLSEFHYLHSGPMGATDQAEGVQAFIAKWAASGAAERANAQLFVAELCDLIRVERPHPKTPDESLNWYVFEKTIPGAESSSNFVDCYKRGYFILESKQGADAVILESFSQESKDKAAKLKTGHGKRGSKGWDTAMERAKAQAENYARRLPKAEIPDGRPPFIMVVDVGHSIALYTDWSRAGGYYAPYPDPSSYRIPLKGLVNAEVRELLHAVWTDPLSLDPSRRSAKVTREIADRLAKLARSLEGKHPPEHVANFLMRCLFTMFSEDVDLLPKASFTTLLRDLKSDPGNFSGMLENLWGTMNTGGLSPILRKKLPRFNGGLFAHADAIDLNADQIQLLIEAGEANWKDVEPAIFGTLLERALDPRERHKLGAHYTPRAYVERLVNPTVIEPLREQWKSVQVAALQLVEQGQDKKAIKEVEGFLHQLATIKVLDPACGSGNFLYVTLELLKRLEGEVVNTLHDLGATSKMELEGVMVTPANFYGIELNPRAAAIAEQVLWIGFLQWHLRSHGNLHNLPEPIIKDLHNIECRDAVLEWDDKTPELDADGKPVTRWDGRSTKPHPVTGAEVPDLDVRTEAYIYSNPRPAKWPSSDYIVGNPPFIGNKRMRAALGDGYVEALRAGYKEVPESCDLVMYWWHKAAGLLSAQELIRFGFITTNSITQTFNRKVVTSYLEGKKPISLVFAIPDHPWVDNADGAAVRIAMTVCCYGDQAGSLSRIEIEIEVPGEDAADVSFRNDSGKIFADLSVGANVAGASMLLSNQSLSHQGVIPLGLGFRLKPIEVEALGYDTTLLPDVIRPYLIGRDLVQIIEPKYIIDFYGLSLEDATAKYPALIQIVRDKVKPERDSKNRKSNRENWWIYGEARSKMRPVLESLDRYIATCRTAKHRIFSFIDSRTLPDAKLIAIGLQDDYSMGVLSSGTHTTWALATGGFLEDRPNYNHSECFVKFPFPDIAEAQKENIRALGEQLDTHRKRQQALHPDLTMTAMYNVLERVRELENGNSKKPLTAKEKKIYEQGLVGILRQLHDELDTAVVNAYGWPTDLGKDEILTRLVALNAERAAEEAQGQVRWLRPEYQAPDADKTKKAEQTKLDVEEEETVLPVVAEQRAWPKEIPAQAAVLSDVLGSLPAPMPVEAIAAHFKGKVTAKKLKEVERLLETFAALGRAELVDGSWVRAA